MARKQNTAQARPRQPAQSLWQRLQPILWTAGQVVTVIAVVGALAWSVDWLRDPRNMPLRSVHIEGEFRKLNTEQLQAAIAGTVQGGFFSVRVDEVRRAAESLPWVASASVRRVWPDGLIVQVVEQRAAARWGDTGVVNFSGQLFEPAKETIPQHLPQLSGPAELRRRVIEHYISMTEQLAPIGRRVAQLSVDERRAWLVRLDDGVEVKLGRDNTLDRIERFVRVYPQLFAARASEMKTVDLRYSNGFAVRWDRSADAAGQQQEG